MKEFPISSKRIIHNSLIFSGGGYFRLFPYPLIAHFASQSKDYLLSYIHPRDLDSGQPTIKGLPITRKFKSYVGLKGAEQKLRRFLTDYPFSDLATAAALIDWDLAPIVKL